MSHGTATRIDISSELAAAERGECLGCRIGGTHKATEACDRTKPYRGESSEVCTCGVRYFPTMLRGKYAGIDCCPDCHDAKGGN